MNIHKLSVPNTVEERILEVRTLLFVLLWRAMLTRPVFVSFHQLQEKKRALAAAALSGDKMKNMKLGMDDLMALFRTNGGLRDSDDEDDDN